MDEYIKRKAAVEICSNQYKECLRKSDWCGDTVAWNIGFNIKALPAADVVSRVAFDQAMWERDIAMKQLEEHGIPFGGKADVVAVVRCKDCKHYGTFVEPCHAKTERFCKLHNGLVLVNRDTFCSYGERRSE